MSITLGPIFNVQRGKIREWRIVMTLRDGRGRAIPIRGMDMPIRDQWAVHYHTISGYRGMTMTQSADTIISEGKNLGKINATNALTQADKVCRSKYAAKIKAGYSETDTAPGTATSAMPFPMAVKTWRDHGSKLTYPLFIQPKLDGVRLLAKYVDGRIELYTRRLRPVVGFVRIREDLLQMFETSGIKTFIVDGELYAHDMNLQTISGIVRNEAADEATKDRLQYHVFDFFDPAQPQLPFSDRHARMMQFMKAHASECVLANPTVRVKSEEEAESLYQSYTRDGYEGIIYKSDQRPYEFDYHKERRSAWYLKRKKQDDAEYEIIGFTHGKGKDRDCIVFVLQTAGGRSFNCVPNGTYEYRKQLYAAALEDFDGQFRGKLAKVLYDDLSKDGVPLRGRITQVGRDIAFD